MSRVVCVCGLCGCACRPCCIVFCVFVVSVLLVVWCGGVALSPPLLVGACSWCLCGCGWRVLWVPRHSWLRVLGAVPRHSWLGSSVVWWWLVPCHSWLRGYVAVPRHSWLGFAAGCGGWFLATPGRGPWAWFPATPGWGLPVLLVGASSPILAVGPGVPFSLALVCVCVLCCASAGVGGVRGRAR